MNPFIPPIRRSGPDWDTFLDVSRAVLDRRYGLRTDSILSQIGVFEYRDRLVLVTDELEVEDKTDALLGVDGIDEFAVYVAPVGKI